METLRLCLTVAGFVLLGLNTLLAVNNISSENYELLPINLIGIVFSVIAIVA